MPFTLKKAAALLALASCVTAGPVFAAASMNDRPDTSNSFFEKGEEGWYWYKDEKKEEEKKEELKKPTPKPEEQQAQKPTTPAGPPAFSVAWLRANVNKYLDRAIDDPTPENVRAFLLIQRIILDKAENFALAMQSQVIGDALVDENYRRGTSTYATNTINKVSKDRTDELLRSLAEKVGIFYFYKADCPYCEAQEPILDYFAGDTGMTVLGVSLDGSPMKTGKFEWREDQGHAAQFNVTSVPALVLVNPNGETVTISNGLLAMEEIASRALLGAKHVGWITDEEFAATRPYQATNNNLAKAMEAKSAKAKEIVKSYQNADGFIEPKKLIPLVVTRAKVTNTDLSAAKGQTAGLGSFEEVVDKVKKGAEQLTNLLPGANNAK
jgi:conjugal transfer pilus assembly protein TraF